MTEKRYRIQNRITGEWREEEANSAQEACQKCGWLIGNCWVRFSPSGGGEDWSKPKEVNR